MKTKLIYCALISFLCLSTSLELFSQSIVANRVLVSNNLTTSINLVAGKQAMFSTQDYNDKDTIQGAAILPPTKIYLLTPHCDTFKVERFSQRNFAWVAPAISIRDFVWVYGVRQTIDQNNRYTMGNFFLSKYSGSQKVAEVDFPSPPGLHGYDVIQDPNFIKFYPAENKGYFMMGYRAYYPVTRQSHPFIMHFDSTGNFIREQDYNLPSRSLPYNLAYTTNGTLMMSAYEWDASGFSRPYVNFLNPNLTINRQVYLPLPKRFSYTGSGTYSYLKPMPDGNYLHIASINNRKVYASIYDSSLTNVLWVDSSVKYHNAQPLEGGNIMFIRRPPRFDSLFWVEKFNPLIPSLPKISVRVEPNPMNTTTIFINSIEFDDSANVYSVGELGVVTSPYPYPWVTKIANVGYPYSPYHPNVPLKVKPTLPREYTATPQPNPTANRFTIPGVGREGVLSLVNASGRVVRQESFVPGSEVDISALPKGLYLFRLVSEGAVTQGKVVRE